MLVSEFIKEYKAAANKEKCIEKHIVSRYIPYFVKMELCRRIIDNSMYGENGGRRVFRPDSPVRYFLFVMGAVENYTDLRFNDGKDGQNIESFDLLEKNGVTEALMKAIGPDVQKLNTVLKMSMDDVADMERSLVPFLDTKMKAWGIAFETFSKAISEKISNTETSFKGFTNVV